MTPVVAWELISADAAPPPLGEALERRFAAMKNPAVKAASASAWALLYRVLRQLSLPVAEPAFGEHGKPYFPGSPVHFSLSHGNTVCAVSVSDAPTGVDTEPNARTFNARMIGRCLSKEELSAFDGDFIRLWCRKECVAKLTGEGLWGYPAQISAFDPRFTFFETLLRLPEGEQRLTAAFSAAAAADHTTAPNAVLLLGPEITDRKEIPL